MIDVRWINYPFVDRQTTSIDQVRGRNKAKHDQKYSNVHKLPSSAIPELGVFFAWTHVDAVHIQTMLSRRWSKRDCIQNEEKSVAILFPLIFILPSIATQWATWRIFNVVFNLTLVHHHFVLFTAATASVRVRIPYETNFVVFSVQWNSCSPYSGCFAAVQKWHFCQKKKSDSTLASFIPAHRHHFIVKGMIT